MAGNPDCVACRRMAGGAVMAAQPEPLTFGARYGALFAWAWVAFWVALIVIGVFVGRK